MTQLTIEKRECLSTVAYVSAAFFFSMLMMLFWLRVALARVLFQYLEEEGTPNASPEEAVLRHYNLSL